MTERQSTIDQPNTMNPSEMEGQTGLTIQDLTLVLQVINLSATRGAFRGDELTTVGALHDRILKFLESVGAVSKNTPTDQDGQR
jgi:hypothetical protein